MNLFAFESPPKGSEAFTTLLEREGIRIKRIVSNQVATPQSFLQEEDEWVVLLEGKASLEMEGKTYILSKGDTLFIPEKTKHTLLQTSSNSVWLAIYLPQK